LSSQDLPKARKENSKSEHFPHSVFTVPFHRPKPEDESPDFHEPCINDAGVGNALAEEFIISGDSVIISSRSEVRVQSAVKRLEGVKQRSSQVKVRPLSTTCLQMPGILQTMRSSPVQTNELLARQPFGRLTECCAALTAVLKTTFVMHPR
jgi:hypothetical protein